jgi:DNA (cytosine-5)-methyltransferase 1
MSGYGSMNVLDLFSGIGGFSLGLERAGMRTVAFCEIDPYCRAVLRKHWPDVPIHEDVRELDGAAFRGVDVICGGFPCQDISQAGKRTGIVEGERSSLWQEFARLIRDIRPRFAIVENVSELTVDGLGVILGDLASMRYDAEWYGIPASYVGRPQARKRIWIVAYPDSSGRQADDQWLTCRSPIARWFDDDRLGEAQLAAKACAARAWRVDDGIPGWVDRIAALGNAVTPEVVEEIGRGIIRASHS